jgi:acyl-CoA synthetase (AMP-forming)/AMP-acid ligase II
VGVLPFFHSFGFTHTLWFSLVTGAGAVYHPNPMDAKSIGELVRKYHGTLLLTTPTFCAGYTARLSARKVSDTSRITFRLFPRCFGGPPNATPRLKAGPTKPGQPTH